jgi:hypothetical protein
MHCDRKGLLHAPKLGHGTDYLTSPPKEGGPRIFYAEKIQRLRPGSNCCEVKWLLDMWGVPTYGNEKVPCAITVMPACANRSANEKF